MKINQYHTQLQDSYLFSTVAKKVAEYKEQHPEQDVISLGIGDVTRALVPAVTDALHRATDEMANAKTFRGYGDEQGYPFLREAVRGHYAAKDVSLSLDEIFIGDGAKSDLGNILDILATDNTVLIPDPVYPAYVDTNTMHGRKIVFMDGNADNEFLPMPNPEVSADLIYLCSPNNPTGAVYSKEQLQAWVDYANANDAVILFDSAYEAFVQDENLPTSIFQIDGARTCAIEFSSLSKTAGFTGTRCGFTVVPEELEREGVSLRKLWLRRQTTKFNGVPYIIQRGAEAVFSEQGKQQIRENITYYQENAAILSNTLNELGIWYTGGVHSPYIWMQCPAGQSSWDFFDHLLQNAHVIGTPGVGFGQNGEGFFRLTAFGTRENTLEAARRISELYR